MQEQWKPIKGYEGLYEVSNLGRVKSLPKYHNCGKQGYMQSEKNLKQIKQNSGYLCVCIYKNGIGKKYLIHRLVAETFIPNPENKTQVNHLDGNKENNCIDNLEWVTQKENIQHAYKTGLHNTQASKDGHKKTAKKLSKPVIAIILKQMKKYILKVKMKQQGN